MRCQTTRRWSVMGVVLAGVLGVAGAALAVDSTPTPSSTPTPTATPVPASTPVAQTLTDLARQTTLQQPTAPAGSGVVISNENLAQYAAKGSLTEVTSPAKEKARRRPAHGAGAAPASPESVKEEAKKAYWRSKYQQQKAVISSVKQEIEKLDLEIPGLWNQFYSWDDPAYRDGVIKPHLDQALARRDELSARLPVEEQRLPEILDEARRDGALPGWFRGLD